MVGLNRSNDTTVHETVYWLVLGGIVLSLMVIKQAGLLSCGDDCPLQDPTAITATNSDISV